MKFNDFLKEALQISGLSKKEIIRRTGIDKSTCYQYFNGKRTPTEEHFLLLLDAFQLGKHDNEVLLEAYQKERYGENVLDRRRLVERCLHILAGKIRPALPAEYVPIATSKDLPESQIILESEEEIRTRIFTLFRDEIENRGDVSIFVSASILKTYSLLPILSYMTEQTKSSGTRIRQIFNFPSVRKDITNSVMQIFTDLLPLMISRRIQYDPFYYCDDASSESSIGFLFPNYIITEKSVLLIRTDGLQAMEYAVPSMVRCYREAFEIAARKSESVRKKYGNIQQLTDYATEHSRDGAIYNIAPAPGALFYMDPAAIKKYIPAKYQEMTTKYWEVVRSLPILELAFPSGLEHFARTGEIHEGGVRLIIDTEDRVRFLHFMMDRIGSNLFFVNEERIQPLDGWEIFAQSGNGIMVEDRQGQGEAFVIREKNIVEAFIDFFSFKKVQGWQMDDHASREWLQGVIDEVSQ